MPKGVRWPDGLLDDCAWLADSQAPVTEWPGRLGMTPWGLYAYLRRRGRPDLALLLERALLRRPPELTDTPCPVCGHRLDRQQVRRGGCCSHRCGQLRRQSRERQESSW